MTVRKDHALRGDMTVGSPLKKILWFAVPLFIGNIFQQVYNLADTAIAGYTLGDNAIAAIGATSSLYSLLVDFASGMNSGFGIVTAQSFGAKNWGKVRRSIAAMLVLNLALAAVLTAGSLVALRPLMAAMEVPDAIFEDAYAYIFIIFVGIPVTYLYNLTSGIIRSLGYSKTPVYFLLMASALNIVLDILFITQFDSGVAGAAYATVISQLVSGIACLIFMAKKFPILRLERDDLRPRKPCMMTLCSMGVPMGLQYSITAIGSVILQAAVNGLGSAAVASMTAASRLSMFVVCPFDALGSTMATYGGQNVGARKLPRIKAGLKSATILGGVYSVFALLLLLVAGNLLLQLFLSANETAIMADARMFLIIQAVFYFPLALVNIVRFLIQGIGFPFLAILAGVMEMIARTLAAIFLVPAFGFLGSAFASPIAWIMADAFLIPAFFYVYKKLSRQMGTDFEN